MTIIYIFARYYKKQQGKMLFKNIIIKNKTIKTKRIENI